MQADWSQGQSSGSNTESNGSPRVGTQIKRSSWNAGTSIDFSQPPPGSPASWNTRRHNRESGLAPHSETESPPSSFGSPSFPSLGPTSYLGPPSSRPRSHSPLRNSLKVPTLDPIRSMSGSALDPEVPEDSVELNEGSLELPPNPFNFTSTFVTPNHARSSASRANQRRGHHYKHSSVSMNFFQEPQERAPLSIPVSLAVPNLGEYWQSITTHQSLKLVWCAFRLILTAFSYTMASPVHSMPLFAHLLAYDTVVKTTIASVEVLANFEVWNKSSLRFPFALKRVEVLVAFGLAVVLLFIAGDIISHTIQDLATDGHGHGHSHEHHGHNDSDSGSGIAEPPIWKHFLILFLSICITFPTAWTQGSANPLALCTLLIAITVLVVPFLPPPLSGLIDNCIVPVIFVTMLYVGYTSSKLFGGMLAMSYGGPDRSETIREIVGSDRCVVQVEDIRLWQVHHDLWLASMKIMMSGSKEDEKRVRNQAVRAVEESIDFKDIDWETTIEIRRAESDYF